MVNPPLRRSEPEVVEVDPLRPDDGILKAAARRLRQGQVVAYPTETFYGLAAVAFDARGCERVFVLKGRSADKALPVILSRPAELHRIASDVPPLALYLGQQFWPGPLTLVLPARAGVAAASEQGTVAVRVSGCPVARALAAAAGAPITATSANRAGRPPALTADEAVRGLTGELALVLDGGPAPGGAPSTIVDVTSGEARLLRAGVIPFAHIFERAHRFVSGG